MRLVCLGVVWHILNYLKKEPHLRNGNMPGEFARQQRSFLELDRWEANELRQFPLYTSHVVLKGIVLKSLFHPFLMLNVAMMILPQESHHKQLMYLSYTKDLLQYFVHNWKNIYGNTSTVYNIHHPLHIDNDCENSFNPTA